MNVTMSDTHELWHLVSRLTRLYVSAGFDPDDISDKVNDLLNSDQRVALLEYSIEHEFEFELISEGLCCG